MEIKREGFSVFKNHLKQKSFKILYLKFEGFDINILE